MTAAKFIGLMFRCDGSQTLDALAVTAVERYRARFQRDPAVIYIHPSAKIDEAAVGVQVLPSNYVFPRDVYVGEPG